MNKLMGIKFRRAFVILLIAALVVGIASGVTLGVMHNSKGSLEKDYRSIAAQINGGKSSMDLKDELSAFANSSSDVKDVYILDKDGKVLFSAKNSGLDTNGKLDLQSASTDKQDIESKSSSVSGNDDENEESGYSKHKNEGRAERHGENRGEGKHGHGVLYDPSNPDVRYMPIGGGLSHHGLHTIEEDESAVQTYSLGSITDKSTGNKTLFIFDIHAVAGARVIIAVIASLAGIIVLCYWLLVALYVYTNARKSKLNATLWAILTLITNLIGLIAYTIYKRVNRKCPDCFAVQSRKNSHCVYCGAALISVCKNCGEPIELGDEFCKSCGGKAER